MKKHVFKIRFFRLFCTIFIDYQYCDKYLLEQTMMNIDLFMLARQKQLRKKVYTFTAINAFFVLKHAVYMCEKRALLVRRARYKNIQSQHGSH